MPPYSFSTDGPSRPVRVLKFGGTSVGSAEGVGKAVRIVQAATETCRPVVVVSAAAGVTDALVQAADEAQADPGVAEPWTRRVGRRYHTLAADALADETLRARYASVLRAELSTLRRALEGMSGPTPGRARDVVLATGERLMVPILGAALTAEGCPSQVVDATALIRTDAAHGDATVQWDATRRQVRRWHQGRTSALPVVTGFIGRAPDGDTTTLGRGGSDLSAAALAWALGAERMERWTDVEGLYTRDPDEHGDAHRLDRIGYEAARTWTKNGRLGMHPSTLDPLIDAGIPLHVRCTHRPEAPGTRIVPAPARAQG